MASPVSIDGFDPSDYSVTSASGSSPIMVSQGVYEVELTPSNAASSATMNLTVNGAAIQTVFGEAFASTLASVPYDVQLPSVTSAAVSNWAKGVFGSFQVSTDYASSVSVGGLPAGIDFNASTGLSGIPQSPGSTAVSITASNPMGSDPQNHQLTVYDPTAFAARMVINPVGAVAGERPRNLPGLLVQLDASSLSDANGSVLSSWPDSSGSGHSLDEVRGLPRAILSPSLGGAKVVSFDGFSQLYSTYDFSSTLTEYTILVLARHSGDSNETIVGSVGSDWVFGWGGGSSAYWKMGATLGQSVPADRSWHLMAGTFDAAGNTVLWRDGIKVIDQAVATGADSVPRRLSLGGSGTNLNFSNSEVAEVLLFDRLLNDSEFSAMQQYLRVKWQGGSLTDFPLLVRMGSAFHPDFSHASFADPVNGADLRFFDGQNRELIHEVDEWNASGATSVWVQVKDLHPDSAIIAYWGNSNDVTPPAYRSDGSLWSGFEGVWHLDDSLDSSGNSRTGTVNGGAVPGSSGVVGQGISLDGTDDSLSFTGYPGITGSGARSFSLWLKSNQSSSGVVGWGAAGNLWNLAWDAQGPYLLTDNAGGRRQGSSPGTGNDQWRHLSVSYPGSGSDLNQTRIYLDGRLVDSPVSSVSGVVNTQAGAGLALGSLHDGSSRMNGTVDEARLSSVARGHAWARHSYENQKPGSTFLQLDLQYVSAPVLPADLNLTVVIGQAMSYQLRSEPPATLYAITSGSLPPSLSFNAATGVISGTASGSPGSFNLSITASNSKGSGSTVLSIDSKSAVEAPTIGIGSVTGVAGRTVDLQGDLSDSGGVSNAVTVYFGDTDGIENPVDWNHSLALGNFDQGPVVASLSGLDSGETYFYRFSSTNSAGTDWSGPGSFTTLSFDQGTLRFDTGENELDTTAGLYWNKGAGEFKVMDANFSTVNYLAPDGTSWMITKANFHFPSDFYLGPNLTGVLLEGVNALSISSDGNVTLAKSLYGSPAPGAPHVPNGTLLDGYDAYYGDDSGKGHRLGRGALGGFGGGQGPGKGRSLGSNSAGGLSGGGGSYAGEGGPGASGPGGIRYGSGGLGILMGGSGGGLGNLGEAAAGGGAIEIISAGRLSIEPGVVVSMNGGVGDREPQPRSLLFRGLRFGWSHQAGRPEHFQQRHPAGTGRRFFRHGCSRTGGSFPLQRGWSRWRRPDSLPRGWATRSR